MSRWIEAIFAFIQKLIYLFKGGGTMVINEGNVAINDEEFALVFSRTRGNFLRVVYKPEGGPIEEIQPMGAVSNSYFKEMGIDLRVGELSGLPKIEFQMIGGSPVFCILIGGVLHCFKMKVT
jgi:hypothetical protein